MSAAIAQVQPLNSARALRGPFDYRLPEDLIDSIEVGSLLVVPFGRREVLGVVVDLADRSEIADERLLAPVRALQAGVPRELVQLAQWIAAQYCSTMPRALRLVLPPGLTRGQLSGKARRTKARRPDHVQVGVLRGAPPPLTSAQAKALEQLTSALEQSAPEPHLLHGVTGSGKTEIYLRVAEVALKGGRGAIVLVPEIALTSQIVSRFLERFGDTVAVLHSRLSAPQRREEWRRLRSGQARVCVGPRSAVFAPVGELGVIVLDEEHDASYKHEGDPRYDAREVAVRRAAQAGALLLAGSATPRPESVHRMRRIVLPQRVDGRPLPRVELLDMRGRPAALHPHSAQALAELRESRGKAIVMLNRRGWSNFLSCRACGKVWSCPNCDVTLVMHRAGRPAQPARSRTTGSRPFGSERGAGCPAGDFLACHHCDYHEPIPTVCECGSRTLARHGTGTERLHDELSRALDDGSFPVFRLDSDTAGADAGRLLRAFQQAPAGVLIGTQMVAKGHDFADVTLGLVLDADATLRFPDFRAEERTFVLVAQLAGRVGRGAEGHVLVQTLAPEARSLRWAAAHDSAAFLAGELDRRRALSYPPFSRLVRVVCAAAEREPALAAAKAIRERLDAALSAGEASLSGTCNAYRTADDRASKDAAARRSAVVLGPASLFRLRGREREALVIKASDRDVAVQAIDGAVRAIAAERCYAKVSLAVDVDPQ